MRHAWTPKFQSSGPTVHSLYCGNDKYLRRGRGGGSTVYKDTVITVSQLFTMLDGGKYLEFQIICSLLCCFHSIQHEKHLMKPSDEASLKIWSCYANFCFTALEHENISVA